jgi:hypothetical protein
MWVPSVVGLRRHNARSVGINSNDTTVRYERITIAIAQWRERYLLTFAILSGSSVYVCTGLSFWILFDDIVLYREQRHPQIENDTLKKIKGKRQKIQVL